MRSAEHPLPLACMPAGPRSMKVAALRAHGCAVKSTSLSTPQLFAHAHGRSARAHLYAGRTPLDEVGGLALTDALQALVHLRRVHISLDDVQDGDVA
eukprot:1138986-Pelagomonas_calceolata.AAC.2